MSHVLKILWNSANKIKWLVVALVDSHFNRLEILVQYLSHQSSSEGLGEAVQMRRLTIVFTARMHKVRMKT